MTGQQPTAGAATSQEALRRVKAFLRDGDWDRAVALGTDLARLYPETYAVWALLGAAATGAGRNTLALDALQRAAALRPDLPIAQTGLGDALHRMGLLDDAVRAFLRAISLDPDCAEAHLGLGDCHAAQNRPDRAVASFGRVIAARPGDARAYIGLGRALEALHAVEAALDAFRRAVVLDPKHAGALCDLGRMHLILGDAAAAVEACHVASLLEPDEPAHVFHLGTALLRQGDLDGAHLAFDETLRLDSRHADALGHVADLLAERGHLPEALAACDRALDSDPGNLARQAQRLRVLARLGDFGAHATLNDLCRDSAPDGSPAALLGFDDNPDRQRLRAQRWAEAAAPLRATPLPSLKRRRPDPLRVGYVFDGTAPPFMACMMQAHDNDRFRIHRYDIAPVPGLTDAAPRPLGNGNDADIVASVRADRLHVVVDLTGFDRRARPGLFARRMAPIQINMARTPCTAGVAAYDYIVGDPVAVPASVRRGITESVIHMPGSFRPLAAPVPDSSTTPARAACGLPDSALVLASFAPVDRISPQVFDIWMRVLAAQNTAVLWLAEAHPQAQHTLRAEARARGIAAGRLLFAPAVSRADHLARLRNADLFLDTFGWSGDDSALCVGVPMVTLAGATMAARVGASQLTALGFPDLVAATPAEYEARATALAGDPRTLGQLRRAIAVAQATAPLFDMKRHTAEFERALVLADERRQTGLPPEDIRL